MIIWLSVATVTQPPKVDGKCIAALGDAGSGSFERTCWNCGKKGCNVRDCNEAKDQNIIHKNRKRYYEYQGKPVPVGKKPWKKRDANYPGTARDKSSTECCHTVLNAHNFSLVNNCLMANCKICGRNSTHITNFQNVWAANKDTFRLPATRPLVVEEAFRGETLAIQPTTPHQPAQP